MLRCSFVSFGHCRSSNQSIQTVRAGKKKEAHWGVYRLLFLLLVCKRSTPHLCSNHFHSDKKQWSFKMNKGIGSALRITDAGKGSWVWERRERIMNFSKSEESLWRNLGVALCFFSVSILPSFSLFNSVSFSPLSLSWAALLFDSVDFTWVCLLTSAYISSVHQTNSFFSGTLIHLNCTSSCFSLRHYHCRHAAHSNLFIFISKNKKI